jgi:hypothetical protein
MIMRSFKSPFSPILLLLVSLLVAACNGEQPAQQAGAEPVVEPTSSVAGDAYELDETYVFPGFGFSMAIPAGWYAGTDGPATRINELEADHLTAFRDDPPFREGYEILHDHRNMTFMRSMGLGEDPTLQDLFELNKRVLGWQEPVEVSETEVFGVPALAARACDTVSCEYALMGFVNDEAFYLRSKAKTEEELDAFLPTFEQMVASIAPEN